MRFIIWNTITLLFVLCALLQFNDPDPLGWILIYSSNAILLFLQSKNLYYRIPSILLLLLSVIGSWWLWPDSFSGFAGDMSSDPNIEYARESIGLLLIAISQVAIMYCGESAVQKDNIR